MRNCQKAYLWKRYAFFFCLTESPVLFRDMRRRGASFMKTLAKEIWKGVPYDTSGFFPKHLPRRHRVLRRRGFLPAGLGRCAVRKHIQNIYAKLNVSDRVNALIRGKEILFDSDL